MKVISSGVVGGVEDSSFFSCVVVSVIDGTCINGKRSVAESVGELRQI
jgi:hypothetical protein